MAYDSAFWDGTVTGHAASTDVWGAPYSSLEYGDVYNKLMGSNAAKGFVVPGYNNNLAVSANSPAAMNVLVATGAMFIRGKIFENTAQATLTIGAADATNPRIDRIVVRISFAAQTIELAVLAGTPAATPALPTLTQNATTYEISLAYVWVAAAVASIAATEVHDERIFVTNFEGLASAAFQTNLLTNSEFMAFSRLNTLVAFAGAPDMWNLVGTVTTWANLAKPSQMSRGRAVRITAGAATSGMEHTAKIRASTTYAIKGLIQVTAGDIGRIVVTTNSASPGTVTKLVRRTGAWIEYLIYYTTEADASTLTLQLLCNSNTDIVDYGQWLAVEGFIPGPFRQIHETILFDWYVIDTNYNNDTFLTTSDVDVDLDSAFQSLILEGTQAIYVDLVAAATNTTVAPSVVVQNTIGFFGGAQVALLLRGLTANTTYQAWGWVSIGRPTREINIVVEPDTGDINSCSVTIKGIVT